MDPFYIALLLYCIAIVLAFVDLFVPSGGLLLIFAGAAALACVLFGFRSGSTMGMFMLTIVAASVPTFAYLAIRIWPNTPIGKRIILKLPSGESDNIPQEDPRSMLVGTVVSTEYALMPSGQIRVGAKNWNAVAKSGMIEAGVRVKIVAIKERNLVVEGTTDPISDVKPANSDGAAASESKRLHTQSPEELLEIPADELGIDSLE